MDDIKKWGEVQKCVRPFKNRVYIICTPPTFEESIYQKFVGENMKLKNCMMGNIKEFKLLEFDYDNTITNKNAIIEALDEEYGFMNYSIMRLGPKVDGKPGVGFMRVKVEI